MFLCYCAVHCSRVQSTRGSGKRPKHVLKGKEVMAVGSS